jgi:hypothetical protein
MKYNLGFISDKDFFDHVKAMVSRLTVAMNLKKFSKNSIDPIKMTVEMHAYQISLEEAVTREIARQMGKTVENAIGWFHQNIFKYIPGWQIPKDGVDVMNDEMTIFAEIKNKNNTMNSSSAETVFNKLKGIVVGNPNATAYLVEVNGENFCPSPWIIEAGDFSEKFVDERIQTISIQRFYEIATHDANAYEKVCSSLKRVMTDLSDIEKFIISKDDFNELKKQIVSFYKTI